MSEDQARAEGDDEVLGGILAEAIERRRKGEPLSVADYIARHPHLAATIAQHFDLVERLEGLDNPSSADTDLAAAVAELSEGDQRLVLLRNLRRMRWPEVARSMGETETDVRRRYARVLRRLLLRCRDFPPGGT